MPDDPREPPEPDTPPAAHRLGAEKWKAVRSALDSWAKTTRLCVIILTLNVPTDILIWLVKH